MSLLNFLVTPSRAGSSLSECSPKAFLTHEEIESPLKRKSAISLRSSEIKKLRLEPPHLPTDKTIIDYYDRVRKEPSVHQKLVVCGSIGNKLETMQSQILSLEDEVTTSRRERGELLERLHIYDEERLYSYSANLLTHELKRLNESDKGNVDKGENNLEHPTTRYTKIATQMDRKVFERKTNFVNSKTDQEIGK